MFNLLDDSEAAEYFSRMSVASHGGERDTGHTGNFFNMLWAMPGVALSGRHATGAWMKEFGWYYDLARRWDGTLPATRVRRPRSRTRYLAAGTAPAPICWRMRNRFGTSTSYGPERSASVAEQSTRGSADSLVADGRGWSPP